MKKYLSIKTAGYAAAFCFLVYTLTGFFLVPFAGEKIIVKTIREILGRTSKIEDLSFNPYTLEARVEKFHITDKSGDPLFRINQIYLNLSISSVFRLAPVITGLELDRPEVFLSLDKKGKLNIADLTENKGLDKKQDESGKVFRFRLSNAQIKNGIFHFSDEIKKQTYLIDKLNLVIPKLSSLKAELTDQTQPSIKFEVNGAPVELNMNSLPFDSSLATRFDLKAVGLDLTPVTHYLSLPKAMNLVSPGRLDLEISGEFKHGTPSNTLSAKTKIVVHELDIRTGENTPLVSCPEIIVQAESKDLFSQDLIVQTLGFNKARLNLEKDENGRFNFFDLIPGSNGQESDRSAAKQGGLLPFDIRMNQGGLNKAVLTFTDRSLSPEFKTRLSDLDIILADLHISPEGIESGYASKFNSEAGETLDCKGNFSSDQTFTITGRIDLKNILAEKYRSYYQRYKGMGMGRADMGTGFRLSLKDDKTAFSLSDGGLAFNDILIRDENETKPIIDVKKILVSGIQVDSEQQEIRIKEAHTGLGRMNLVRNKAGQTNLLTLIDRFRSPAAGPELQDSKTMADGKTNSWNLFLNQLNLENYHLTFADKMPEDPVHLTVSDIMIAGKGLGTAKGTKGSITSSMTWQDTGKIKIGGSIGLLPAVADLDLDIGQIKVKPFQPYFTEYLNILVDKGQVNTSGRLSIAFSDPEPPEIKFTGRVALNEFVSKTKSDENDFFKCKSLYLTGMDISLVPMKLRVKDIALTDFYQKVMISKSGELNLKGIMVDKEPVKAGEPEEKPVSSSENSLVEIDTITLQAGHINFLDQFNSPGFAANMTEIGGSITGLSSAQDKAPAVLQLKGTHGLHSPLDISGTIDPLKQLPSGDLAISFKNIELPNFTPYAEKYLGYEIEKGKLILDLKYTVRAGELNSSNHLFFDQLTLGKSVDSPDATSLPVQLAISLLKNSNDEIELDLPIKGDLNDPEFSYGDVIFTSFSNLILGVVTAPFKFLGSIVGLADNQDLEYVAFSPGSEVLDEESKVKMDYLIDILTEKETLKLEIDGKYDPLKDGERLRDLKYTSLLNSMLPEESGKTLDTISDEERKDLIESAYAAAKFPKPRQKSGKEKMISLPEKEKLLTTGMTITQEEFNSLARARALHIRELLHSGKIDPVRIFVLEPNPVPKAKQGEPAVKTLFRLK